MMHDLALKMERLKAMREPLFILLTPKQFDIASFMKGKSEVSSKQISKHLGIEVVRASWFLNSMRKKKLVTLVNRQDKDHSMNLYDLAIKDFVVKKNGKGINKCPPN